MTYAQQVDRYCARWRAFCQRTSNAADPLSEESEFNALALELFSLQQAHNPLYCRFCETRGAHPGVVQNWEDIPAVPTAAFKDFALTSVPPGERVAVFHSSGTTGQGSSEHHHSAASLALYEASLRAGFAAHGWTPAETAGTFPKPAHIFLTPPPERAPHSSLVHMFETLRRAATESDAHFTGDVDATGGWTVDGERTRAILEELIAAGQSVFVLGTAFSFVHLAEHLDAVRWERPLPAGSRVLETGGYKGRARNLTRPELHALISRALGVPTRDVLGEYGMCELSSQAYDHPLHPGHPGPEPARAFRFPPWARIRIISPETGREVPSGETGLIRVWDLANVSSVLAVQTADLGRQIDRGFELLGRAAAAEPRGCSLLAT